MPASFVISGTTYNSIDVAIGASNDNPSSFLYSNNRPWDVYWFPTNAYSGTELARVAYSWDGGSDDPLYGNPLPIYPSANSSTLGNHRRTTLAVPANGQIGLCIPITASSGRGPFDWCLSTWSPVDDQTLNITGSFSSSTSRNIWKVLTIGSANCDNTRVFYNPGNQPDIPWGAGVAFTTLTGNPIGVTAGTKVVFMIGKPGFIFPTINGAFS